MTINDHIITHYETINSCYGIDSFRKKLIQYKYLVVIDDNGNYIGVLTLNDVFMHPHKMAIDCLSEKLSLDYGMTIKTAAQLFIDNDFEALPVFKEGVFYGVMTNQIIINLLLTNENESDDIRVNPLPIQNGFEDFALFEYNGIGERKFFLSDNWMEITGVDPLSIHKAAKMSWFSHLHPSCSEQVMSEISQFVNGETKKVEQIIKINHPRKGWIWLYIVIRAKESNKRGKPVHTIAFIRDVSEMQQSFDGFASQEALFNKIFNNSKSLVYYKNALGEFKFVNDAFLKFFNVSKESVINKNKANSFIPNYISNISKNDEETIKTGKYRSFEEQLSTEKGIAIFMSNKTPVFDSQNNVEGIFGISTDITNVRRIEQELIRANQKAVEINKKLQQELRRRQQIENENIILKEELNLEHCFNNIICEDENFRNVLKQIEKVANSDTSVLITGETGTGKELIAKAIHQLSKRRNAAFVKINCSAIPENLIESELFGHEKGSFTGAFQTKIGKFEFANGGTLFLDEIAELPMNMQPKLLRVLQENEFERIGSNKTVKTNVRIISATNKNLLKEIYKNKFREDLYYRLNVFPIHIPPLRERKKDISPLVNSFVKKYSDKNKKHIEFISSQSLEKLINYSWPGNIRELENLIERAVILSTSRKLNIDQLIPKTEKKHNNEKVLTLEEMEREYILKILEMTSWKISGNNGAATLLGLKRTTLNYRMNKLGISYQKHLFQEEEEDTSEFEI